MAYAVKELAKLSGVTVRALHFYDEVGLLKPAYYGANGYRFYEEKQLLALQQILFFRELGFELKQIQRLLGRSDFDQAEALKSHRKVLKKSLERTEELIRTIACTNPAQIAFHSLPEFSQSTFVQSLTLRRLSAMPFRIPSP